MGVAVFMGGCVWAMFMLAVDVVRAGLGDWTRALVAAGIVGLVVALCVVFGVHDGSALALYMVPVPVLWRWAHRGSWEACIGSWLRPAWRRWRVYDKRWPELMRGCHLHRPLNNRPDPMPRIVSIRTTRCAACPAASFDSVVIRTLPGQVVADFADHADDFAHELGARSCRAFEHPRVRGLFRRHPAVRLELGYGPDPLREMVPAFPIPERPEDVDLSAIPVGLTEHGEIWTIPLLGSHLFVAGVTGSGKGSVLWSILRGIAPLIRDGSARVWAFDPKGGVELNIGHDPHDLFFRYCDGDPQEHADMLSDAVTAMKDQLVWLKVAPVEDVEDDLFGIRKLERPTPEHPLNLILVDEFADLAAKQETTDLTKQLDSATRQLVNKGRAPGFPMVVFVQNPTAETSKHRNELQVRSVALALQGGRVRVDMVLGDGAYESGAHCDKIDPVAMPGVGYFRMPGEPVPVRVRAAYVSDADIRQMARDYAPLIAGSV